MTFQDVKRGDQVRCIDDDSMWHLTVGNVYSVIYIGTDTIMVVNDRREVCYYSIERFEPYRINHEDPFKALEDALQRCIQKSEDNIKSMRECLKNIQSPTS